MRTIIAVVITAFLAVAAAAFGGYLGLSWGRATRAAIAVAPTVKERAVARRKAAHQMTLAMLAALAFLIGFVIKVGMPRWLIGIAVAYGVLGAAALELQARWRRP